MTREILWRRSPLKESRWLGLLTFCACLAFSALSALLILSRPHDRQLSAISG